MRKLGLLFLLCLLYSCSNELRVYTDFDRSVSIQKLTRYKWLSVPQIEDRNNPLYLSELNDKRVKTSVDAQLKGKGYIQSDTADFIVHYHLTVENKTSVRPEPFGYNYGRYWIENELDTYRYREGTLIIDLMDSKNCNLIWRGWAVSVLEDDVIAEEIIDKAVVEVFKKFPMSAAKEVTLP